MRWRRVVYGGHRRRHARRSSKDSGGGLFILAIVVLGLLSYAANYVGWPAVIVAHVVRGGSYSGAVATTGLFALAGLRWVPLVSMPQYTTVALLSPE